MAALYVFGFGSSETLQLGLFAREAGQRSLADLRTLFGDGCVDLRERAGTTDRDIPRTADGGVDGVVRVEPWGLTVKNGSLHGFFWTEVFAGLSLRAIRELLAHAADGRH